MKEPFGIIYLALNKVTGLGYVGQTTRALKRRWKQHQSPWSTCRNLRLAIERYGPDAFEVSVLDTANSADELNLKELAWIRKLGTLAPTGYNVLLGGDQPSYMRESRSVGRKKYLADLAAKGFAKGPSPLTASDVEKVVRDFNDGVGVTSIAASLKVHQSTISHILSGRNWKHLNIQIERTKRNCLTFEMACVILGLFREGSSVANLCVRFNRSKASINKVLRGATYPDAFKKVTGADPTGKRACRAYRVPVEVVQQIKCLRSSGWSYPKIAKEFGMPVATVFRKANNR